MKSTDTMVREYVGRLSDDDLRFLSGRYKQNMAGDRAEIANFLSRNREIDRWLGSAGGPSEWFDMMDEVGTQVIKEYDERTQRYAAEKRKAKEEKVKAKAEA